MSNQRKCVVCEKEYTEISQISPRNLRMRCCSWLCACIIDSDFHLLLVKDGIKYRKNSLMRIGGKICKFGCFLRFLYYLGIDVLRYEQAKDASKDIAMKKKAK